MKTEGKKIINFNRENLNFTNVAIIVIMIFAIIYFIFCAFKLAFKDLISNEEEIKFDVDNPNKYSIENSDQSSKTIIVSSYEIFYNIKDIIENIYNTIKVGDYSKIYKVYTASYRKSFESKEVAISRLEEIGKLFNDNDEYNLEPIQQIENTNMYICILKFKNSDSIKIVLNIDFDNSEYAVEYIGVGGND